MLTILLVFIITFVVSAIFAPFVIRMARRVGARQEILQYVTAHQGKQGTPTMGGLIFILPIIGVTLAFASGQASICYVALGVFFSYALLGFLDDFIKVHTHKNLGLRAYQKIIGQLGIAIIIALYVYNTPEIGTSLILPWGELELGWGIIPLIIFVFIAMTNSANLTDGLDGLAGWTSFVMIVGLTIILGITQQNYLVNGGGQALAEQLVNLQLLGSATAGGLLAFLIFNSYPARIFMGDTGSLALGGVITCLAVFSRQTLILPLICLVFVVSAVSVIIQVLHYKRTKRRVFLMAPLHHHFEKKGVNETKIVAIYIIITIIVSVISIMLTL
ncbi:MAG: phospho-N-acetylmuramoyl-pentapeptide-transferase [Clostridia bacterium]|nr:phospho-N-acetylmuramoyl-pentapeptide-transferase [Clostridia bacterium]